MKNKLQCYLCETKKEDAKKRPNGSITCTDCENALKELEDALWGRVESLLTSDK